jgi:hypothetical protein
MRYSEFYLVNVNRTPCTIKKTKKRKPDALNAATSSIMVAMTKSFVVKSARTDIITNCIDGSRL